MYLHAVLRICILLSIKKCKLLSKILERQLGGAESYCFTSDALQGQPYSILVFNTEVLGMNAMPLLVQLGFWPPPALCFEIGGGGTHLSFAVVWASEVMLVWLTHGKRR